jgi:hypothetical protein
LEEEVRFRESKEILEEELIGVCKKKMFLRIFFHILDEVWRNNEAE